MKIKTVEQLLATLLIGVLVIGSLFVSCEPDNSYYSWENNNDNSYCPWDNNNNNSYYPWENTSPIEEPTANEQVVPQQFSTNAKILAVKSNDNGCLFLLYCPGNEKAPGDWKTEKYIIFALRYCGDIYSHYHYGLQVFTDYKKAEDTFNNGYVKSKY